jgi:hypothetical protein
MIPFVFSDDEKFILIFHEVLVPLEADDGDVEAGGDAGAAASDEELAGAISVIAPDGTMVTDLRCPYLASEWFGIQYKQINDVMFLAHGNHAPMRLERGLNAAGDAAEWHLFELDFNPPVLLDENRTEKSLSFVYSGGAEGMLNASDDTFGPGHVGAYFELRHRRVKATAELDLSYNSSTSVGVMPPGKYYFLQKVVSIHFSPSSGSSGSSGSDEGMITVVFGEWFLVGQGDSAAMSEAWVYASEHLFDDGYPIYGDQWDFQQIQTAVDEGYAWHTNIKTYSDSSFASGTLLSDSVLVVGDWYLTTTNYWYGTLWVERAVNEGTESLQWERIREYTSQSDRNVSSASGHVDYPCFLRLRYSQKGDPFAGAVWTGSKPSAYAKARAVLESENSYDELLLRVTEVVSARQAKAKVVSGEPNDAAVTAWAESAWSDARGFPSAVGLYEQRIYWANTRKAPNTFWASAIDDFQNFRAGSKDSDALAVTLAATEQNGIMWLEQLRRFHALTKSRDFSITGGEQDGTPVSATNIIVRSEAVAGAVGVQPVAVGDTLLFAGRGGIRLYELAYSLERDGYIGNDISMLAPDLLAAGIVQVCYARQPDNTIYCLMADGTLAALCYMPAENVNAWGVMRLSDELGPVSGMCVLPGTYSDEVWILAGDKVMRVSTGMGAEEGVHLDCSLIVTGAALHDWGVYAMDAEGGTLSYPFEKFDCVVFKENGGRVHFRDLGFSENGALYFPEEVSGAVRCVIGLPYSGELETMPVDMIFQDGPAAGLVRRIVEVTPHFHETVSCKLGRGDALLPVDFRNTADRMDAVNPAFSGYTAAIKWAMGSSREETIRVVQDLPFPCTVLGLAVKWEAFV